MKDLRIDIAPNQNQQRQCIENKSPGGACVSPCTHGLVCKNAISALACLCKLLKDSSVI
jgi:hypothetical protein